MLVALILRGVAFEFRSKRTDPKWRNRWDWAIFVGSLLPALLWGVAVGNLIRGFAIDADMNYWGGLLPLLNPFSILSGLVFVSLFTMHGANYLCLKVEGKVAEQSMKTRLWVMLVATLLTVVFVVWAFFGTDILTKSGINGLIPAILAAIALLASDYFIWTKKNGLAFIMSSLTILFATVMVFAGLFPRILISTLDPSYTLDIWNSASSPYTLTIMTIVAGIFVPIVLVYQIWIYRVFRKRIKSEGESLIY